MDQFAKSFPFICMILLAGCAGQQEKEIKAEPIHVTVQPIRQTNQLQQLVYSGTIEAENTAQVGFSVAGVINNVAVQEGQFVKQGQLLVTIDDTEYSNALAIASAGLEQAEDLYNRLNELYGKGSLPAKDYIDIKTKLAQAKANKSINAKHIADSRLYAPMSGIITGKFIERGSTAAPGVPAFTIVKTDKVYAKIAVPESEVGNLKKSMQATVYIPTLHDSVTGPISIINPQADAASKTFSIKILLNNSRQQLLPGMLANIKINPGITENAITIPATAVVRDADDITYVYVVNAQNKAIRKRIIAGHITGKEEIIVTNGLQEGEKVVTAGQTRLKDGESVVF